MSPPDERGRSRIDFGRGLITGAVVAVLLLVLSPGLRDAVLPSSTEADRVEEAREVIERVYFQDADPELLDDASIQGMVRALKREHDDRFSHYFDPEAFELFRTATSGQFSGVGMTVSEVKRGLRVARVFEATPAEDGGLAVGDVITAVEGESIAGVAADEASARIKGPRGTEVELTVIDGEEGGRRDVTLERAEVRIPAVDGELRRVGGKRVAYVLLATFSNGAHGELRERITELDEEGAEGLVLDLRGNGGGLLQEAVLVTSLFQEQGPIVTTEGRSRPAQTLEAEGDALESRPMVVLANRDTASASEIVSAALQQNDIATIVGTRTFGKGSFQEVIELDDGGALDLTVGEYLTSDGSSIQDAGVKPDVRVTNGVGTGRDAALRRGLRIVADEIDARPAE